MSPLLAALLGIVEGLTEFLPISSTGHLILVGHFLGIEGPYADAFDIVVQLGALVAVVVHYRKLLLDRARDLATGGDRGKRLALALFAAFAPTALVGFLFGKKIKHALFGPLPVAIALVVGGLVMIGVETALRRREAKLTKLDDITPARGFVVGLGQCLALFPGVSRSMSTIVTARLLGCDTSLAAEFSFLLALPTLGAATVYELLKSWRVLLADESGPAPLIIGMGVSFVVAWVVIAAFLRLLPRIGLTPFGVYRILLGLLVFRLVAP